MDFLVKEQTVLNPFVFMSLVFMSSSSLYLWTEYNFTSLCSDSRMRKENKRRNKGIKRSKLFPILLLLRPLTHFRCLSASFPQKACFRKGNVQRNQVGSIQEKLQLESQTKEMKLHLLHFFIFYYFTFFSISSFPSSLPSQEYKRRNVRNGTEQF